MVKATSEEERRKPAEHYKPCYQDFWRRPYKTVNGAGRRVTRPQKKV